MAINYQQEALQLNDTIAISGIFPNLNGGGGAGMTLGMHHVYAYSLASSGTPQAAGQSLSVDANMSLFALLGTTYGGNGETDFWLPDTVLSQAIGAGNGPGLSPRSIGEQSGSATGTLLTSELPAQLGGGTQNFSDEGPQLTERYFIAVEGIFPSQGGGGARLDLLGSVVKAAFEGVPGGYVACEGQLLDIDSNTALFAVIGTLYGGDGQTTFALPDLRGRTVVGAGGDRSVGETFGQETLTINSANLPVNMGGGGVPMSNEEPSLAMTFCIALDGLFPSQFSNADYETPMLGEIVTFAGGFVPRGFAACNGQLLPIAGNIALYALLGDTYGGDNITTFGLPDLRDRSIVGMSSGATLGQVVGSNEIILTSADFPDLNYSGTAFDGTHYGADGNDTINGLGGADSINGGAGVDTLDGGEGDDTITDSHAGTVRGGAGNDTLINTFVENATWDGGADNDTLDTSQDGFNGEIYDLSAVSFEIFGTTFSNFENITDNNGSNTLIGSSVANILRGGGGGDALNGGGGNDTADYTGSNAAVLIGLNTGGTVSGGHATGDTLVSIENLTGSAFGDTLIGSSGQNVLSGGEGIDTLNGSNNNDQLFGGTGNDLLAGSEGADVINGGANDAGGDTATYANHGGATGVTVNLLTGTATGNGHGTGDTLVGIENVIGSAQNDSITGDGNTNVLTAGNGLDTLNGGGGADTLNGQNGDDTLIGGEGADANNGGGGAHDKMDYSASADGVFVDLRPGFSGSGGDSDGDTWTGIEDVTGSAFGDQIVGSTAANILLGGLGDDTLFSSAGADVMNGGGGTGDSADYGLSNGAVNINLLVPAASGGHAAGDTLFGIENLTGSNFGDTLTGNNLINRIFGGGGDDTLSGNGNGDTMIGGTGNDTMNGGTGADIFLYTDLLFGDDVINGWQNGADKLDFTVFGWSAGDFTITASGGDALLTSNFDPTETIRITGMAGQIDGLDFV